MITRRSVLAAAFVAPLARLLKLAPAAAAPMPTSVPVPMDACDSFIPMDTGNGWREVAAEDGEIHDLSGGPLA